MILATIRMTFSAKGFGEALTVLRSMAEQSKFQPGCHSCRIYRSGETDNVLMFQQLWTDEESMQAYLRSDDFRHLLLLLEMGIKPPEIRFDTISSSTGIETIEKARNHSGGWEGA